MSICTDVSLISSLLTDGIMDKINTVNEDPFSSNKGNEKRMLSVAKLIIAVMEQTAKGILNKDLVKFNGLTGNHTCQLVSLFLLEHADSEPLHNEARALLERAKQLKKIVNDPSLQKPFNNQEFFQVHFRSLAVSRDISFLMKCFLLNHVRQKDFVDEGGFVVCKTDPNKLSSLIGKPQLNSEIAKTMLDHCASRLSDESLEYLRGRIGALQGNISLLQRMFSDPHIRKISHEKGFIEKTFSPIFFQMEAVLKVIKKNGGIVALQQIASDKQSGRKELFFQSSENGFKPVLKEEISKETPVVVFKAIMRSDLGVEDLAQKIDHIGFENLVLMLSAQEPPYDRKKSKLDDLDDEEGKQLIRDFISKAGKNELDKNASPFLELRHVLCVTRSKIDEAP